MVCFTVGIQDGNGDLSCVGEQSIGDDDVQIVAAHFFAVKAFSHVQFAGLPDLELRTGIAGGDVEVDGSVQIDVGICGR